MLELLAARRWPRLKFTDAALRRLDELMVFLDQLWEDRHPHAEDVEVALHAALERLDRYGGPISDEDPRRRFRITLGQDFAPLSFSLLWERLDLQTGTYTLCMQGGLIWHGGSNDPLAITCTPSWFSIHT